MKPECKASSWHVKNLAAKSKQKKRETASELITVMKPFILGLRGERKKETNKQERGAATTLWLFN